MIQIYRMPVKRMLQAAVLLCALVTPAFAQLVNENLLVEMPKGYKVGWQDRKSTMLMTEMVPEGETVENWTEMVTVQIFRGMQSTPTQFRERMQQLWSGNCANSKAATLSAASENGYPATVWRLDCPLNQKTGKPEITWFKAVQGNDAFYVVQKAYKFAPSSEQITQWDAFLARVSVCDSRLPDRACKLGVK